MLIIMGGPMSVNDETEFPWLFKEKQFIRKAVEKEFHSWICLERNSSPAHWEQESIAILKRDWMVSRAGNLG